MLVDISPLSIDPMFPTQVCVDDDNGFHIWMHDAATLLRWLQGARCTCMIREFGQGCVLHGIPDSPKRVKPPSSSTPENVEEPT
jgi:hypothetical protein